MSKHYKGIAGKRSGKMQGVVIHNDAGGAGANKAYYQKWLVNHNAEIGFAHAYVTSTGTLLFENEGNRAWHAGNAKANNDYYSIEVCQSKGSLDQFKKNEVVALKLAAAVLKRNGLKATRSTVRLHKEFSATACPHRSFEIHGKNNNKVKDYFISEINKYMGATSTPSKPSTNVRVPAGAKVMAKTHTYETRIAMNVRKSAEIKKDNVFKTIPTGSEFRSNWYLDKNGYRWLEYYTGGVTYYVAEQDLKTKEKFVNDISNRSRIDGKL